ncbi:hypothetical protein FA09DRAFT_172157 [Tilletiopsis washingtonensis]|uniref:Uncharacterized protein n=1 Tax=Tilletiopsis washingtonensis TaxID=58919 RepID=A0A316Z0V4_9BASI|nr:hypothetical protein FA09DRAFT_172157 [Tilletiopsis washingtonensis]PWN94664.1 hypothetical protein FA09DRAFT_172157 [Tilletiopsis washingtonensis]
MTGVQSGCRRGMRRRSRVPCGRRGPAGAARREGPQGQKGRPRWRRRDATAAAACRGVAAGRAAELRNGTGARRGCSARPHLARFFVLVTWLGLGILRPCAPMLRASLAAMLRCPQSCRQQSSSSRALLRRGSSPRPGAASADCKRPHGGCCAARELLALALASPSGARAPRIKRRWRCRESLACSEQRKVPLPRIKPPHLS